MSHRVFKPVILFHDHSYSTDTSGVTHRIHIPYGDPHYTPLIQQKKHKVGIMLKNNGQAWYDIIQSTRQSPWQISPTPPSLVNHRLDRRCNQSLLQPYGPNRHTCKNDTKKQREEEEDDDESDTTSTSSSSCSTVVPTMIQRRRRGNLPKTVTAVLKQWLVDHCRNPYPTEAEKTGLKDKTGLTLNQISNWFINARRRLLPQIIDTMLPQYIEEEEEPIPRSRRKRRSTKDEYLYDEDDQLPSSSASSSPPPPTTVIRKRRRYNKKSNVTSSSSTSI